MPAEALTLSHEDWLGIEREYCRRSLSNFVKAAWPVFEPGNRYVHGWHVDAICEHLEAVTCGEISRLLINIPPGCMKSSLVNILWPAWEWGPMELPHYRIISAAHEQGLAIRDNRAMRRILTSDWYSELWPIEFAGDQNQKTYFENSATGFRQACSTQSMTGRRGHRVLWDDPISAEHANSAAHLDTVLREFQETLPTRYVDPARSANVIVMQRLNERDVSGHILASNLNYEHLMLPMRFEPERRCVTSIGFQDPRDKAGDLLFPERFPEHVVDRDETTMTDYAVAGQHQQRPAPRGGGIFKSDWWEHSDALPKIRWRMIYGDTAQKSGEENDYSVFQCWGMGRDKRIYLLDQIRGKWESPELLTRAKAFWEKHKAAQGVGVLRGMKVEDKVSGTGLIQQLCKKRLPVEGIERDRDKVSRAHDVAPQVKIGNVVLPESAEWLSDYLAEFSVFPNGANDDQVDPTMDAIYDMLIDADFTDYTAIT